MNSLNKSSVGVVGLGLMGTSIITDLLINDQKVVALAPISSDLDDNALHRIKKSLQSCYERGMSQSKPEVFLENLTMTRDYHDLAQCWIVMECVSEKIEIKKDVYNKIELAIGDEVLLTSNTSAIPISTLQQFVRIPHRFFGMHWAEPAYTTRFLEIICGEKSSLELGEKLHRIANGWGKEPTLVRKDIRGFITNRIMYAMYREAFHLVENGYATIEDVDRACKNDGGHWMTFCGLFRYMDLTGLQAYHTVMKDLFPELSNRTSVPKLIDDIARKGGNGISNGIGFYNYTPEQSKKWEESFEEFSFEISQLSSRFSESKFLQKSNGRDNGKD
ncbi:MAG: 3-hydroxyacyl-CoA dehydrogenase family protein [Cyclobacteriaceae bacterium]|nr:3-hydroxyacyl-CoA dehydrogenase family protein [Cyclobacteriaceae bacterium SS2]